jgi:hypothetical protein
MSHLPPPQYRSWVLMTECTKRLYETQWAATRALLAVQPKMERLHRKVPTGAYFCSTCRGWHLTSKSKTQIPPWARRRAPQRV